MKPEDVQLLIAEGEGLTVEFKERYSTKIDRDLTAFANSRGGVILLGVADDGRITGETLSNQMKAEILSLARNCDPHIPVSRISQAGNVVAVEIPEGLEKPYSCSSGYFRRLDAVTQKMSQKEIRGVFRETTDLLFESLPCPGIRMSDISLLKVQNFLKESGASFKVDKANLETILVSIGAGGKGHINNAGAMMFAADIGGFIPYCEIVLCAFKGTTKTHIYDRKDVRDSLPVQLREAMEFLKKHINIRSEIHELDRHDIYELPLDALREALVNAVVHRDYSIRGTSIYVNVFDDRVEIENPGGIPAGLSPKDFGKASVRRNLVIADLFHRMGKVERIGSGIKRMRDLMAEAGLQRPRFETTSFFRAVFFRDAEYALKQAEGKNSRERLGEKLGERLGERLGDKLVEKLGENESKICHFLKAGKYSTMTSLAAVIGISTTAVEKNIAKLKKKGVIRRVGPARGGHWEVLK